jgi:hypothetical protein
MPKSEANVPESAKDLKGRAKEAAGEITGDSGLKHEAGRREGQGWRRQRHPQGERAAQARLTRGARPGRSLAPSVLLNPNNRSDRVSTNNFARDSRPRSR